jgi:outer membrane receptor for ferrienterochelin and colicins
MNRWRNSGPCLALALLLAFPLSAQAQTAGTVSGTVVDESGAALPGVNVQLSGPGTNKFETTGADGTYSFSGVPAGSHKLTVSLIGFGTATQDGVAVTEGGTAQVPPVTLKIALRGEEVVVTASKVESSLVNAPATMTVLTNETLQASPAQNYGDLLRSVPGLNVIQTSARDINITSRQGTSTLSNSQLALLDGRSIYLDFFGLILWDFVPSNPSEIKQIEVVRGPASAVWGANALTGVVNIITKTPRESPVTSVTLTGGTFSRDAGSTEGQDAGRSFGGHLSHAGAPNDTWSYRISGGYFDSDAFPRPTGIVPVGTHPLDPTFATGGATYPADRVAARPGEQVFQNQGTKQPKVDLRLDQDLSSGGRITYSGGYAGTEGIVHTGIGPFDLQNGSYLAYGRLGYTRGGLKAAAFLNTLNGDAPNLLSVDATTGQPLDLTFDTKTYDLELGYTHIVAERHILSYGGNARRNQFDITIAPSAEDRTELGAYFQDEIFFDRFRFAIGGRVDKFGNIEDPVFSPRLSAMFKPAPAHSFRVSYNRAFRSPSAINNYLEVATVTGQLPLGLINAQLFGTRQLSIVTRSVGSQVPQIGEAAGHPLKEESLTAYEVGYTGTFNARTTVGLAAYINDTEDNINFITDLCRKRYTSANPPPGWDQALAPLPPAASRPIIDILFATRGVCLPAEFTYLNLGKLRNVGFEASIEHSFSRTFTGFANYSWQDEPEPRDDSYPIPEISLPPKHRVNAGVNANTKRFLGSLSVNYASEAFWTDVLGATFNGPTDAYTMVNASFGVKWLEGKLITSVKGVNILGDDNFQGGIQQHNFGDIITRQVVGEVRYVF